MTAQTMVFGVVDPDVEHVLLVPSVDTPYPLLASFEGAEQLQRTGREAAEEAGELQWVQHEGMTLRGSLCSAVSLGGLNSPS